MIKFIDVFDCDGVLLSSLHRYRTDKTGQKIDLKYWIDNCTPEKIWLDSPLPMAEHYKKCLADSEHYVIIATARVCQQADFDCIYSKLGKPNKFICRQKGDSQGGVSLKMAGLRKLINLKQFQNAAWSVFEDNKAYLNGICAELATRNIQANPIFIQSEQGH